MNKSYAELVRQAEAAVTSVKDPALKETAFARILDDLLGSSSSAPTKERESARTKSRKRSVKSARPATQKRKGPTVYVQELIDEDFFSSPKTIGELRDELGTSGHHIPVTTLSGLLQRLCQNKILRRHKAQEKGFVYSNWQFVRAAC